MPVGDMIDRKERPAYVRFERIAVEDIKASQRAGHYVARDVDMAHITPPYSKDVFHAEVDKWFTQMQTDIANGRIPQEWADQYKSQYDKWKTGQEMPLNGTPIKGWAVISPAQQDTLLRLNILTVEDLAQVTDEGQRAIGMGALELRHKASAWLAQAQDKGPLTMEVARLKQETATQQGTIDTLSRQVEELTRLVKVSGVIRDTGHAALPEPQEITASDLLDDEPAKRRPGRPPKGREE